MIILVIPLHLTKPLLRSAQVPSLTLPCVRRDTGEGPGNKGFLIIGFLNEILGFGVISEAQGSGLVHARCGTSGSGQAIPSASRFWEKNLRCFPKSLLPTRRSQMDQPCCNMRVKLANVHPVQTLQLLSIYLLFYNTKTPALVLKISANRAFLSACRVTSYLPPLSPS